MDQQEPRRRSSDCTDIVPMTAPQEWPSEGGAEWLAWFLLEHQRQQQLLLLNSSSSFSSPAQHIPCDVIPNILSFVDAETLCRASQVCTSWRDVANQEIYWQRLCERRWAVSLSALSSSSSSALPSSRTLYKMTLQSLRKMRREILQEHALAAAQHLLKIPLHTAMQILQSTGAA